MPHTNDGIAVSHVERCQQTSFECIGHQTLIDGESAGAAAAVAAPESTLPFMCARRRSKVRAHVSRFPQSHAIMHAMDCFAWPATRQPTNNLMLFLLINLFYDCATGLNF